MAKPSKTPKSEGAKARPDEALLAQAKADWKTAESLWSDNRKDWLEDAKFRIVGKGNQWPAAIKKARDAENLPCLESDQLNQYVKQVVNDGRQNRPAVKVRPVDDDGDQEVAEALQGLVRHICDRSNADEAFDTALDHAAGCGFGFFRILTEYAHEKTFNQELVVRRVPNPLAVMLGPHTLADGSDTRFGFVIEDVPKDEYKKRYPNAKMVNWASDAFSDGWSDEENARVCEYWYKVEEPSELHLLADGTTATQEEYELSLEGLIPGEAPIEIVDTRDIPVCKVKWCRLSGAEILEKNDWLGKYIPIVPVYGNESNIEGKITYSGLIRAAKDPQRLYNFSRSAFATRVALTTKAPWMVAAESIDGYPEWRTANSGTHQALKYKAYNDAGQPLPQPQRISPSDVPSGFAEDMAISKGDIQASMGMYAASLGEKSNEKSGRAIMARQREGDTATFHYQDNLSRAIRHMGRILVDAAPKYYDSRRVIRILGEDGDSTMATIDPEMGTPVEKKGSKAVYNLNIGTYDVSVATGPSYTTKRQESADAMIELTRANPTMWQTHGDLIVKSQDWPNAEEFAKRSKLTLPPEIRQAVDAEEQGQGSPEVEAIKQQAEQMIGQAQEQIQAAEKGIADRDNALEQLTREIEDYKRRESEKTGELVIKAREVGVKEYEAETKRIQALAPATPPEQVAQIVQLTVQRIMEQPAPMQPPEPPPLMEAPMEQQPPPGGFFTPEGM